MTFPKKATCLVLFLVLSSYPSFSWGDDALKKRVQEEYPPALRKLESRYGSMHGQADYIKINTSADNPAAETTLDITFAFAPGAAKISSASVKDWDKLMGNEQAVFQTVFGFNPDYYFNLVKRQPNVEFALKSVSEDKMKGRATIANQHGGEIQCALSLGQLPVSHWFDNKRMRIDEVSEESVVDGSRRLLIRYTVTRPPNLPKPSNAFDLDGWLIVAPNDGWIIHEFGMTLTGGSGSSNTTISKIEYSRSADGHLDPVKHVQRKYSNRAARKDPGKPFAGFDLVFKSVKYEALPDAEFRLPAFGLPEMAPLGKKGVSTAQPYGLFALSVAGFGAAGGLRYLSVRRKRS